MTRYAVLSEELYRLSLSLETHNKCSLGFAAQRNALIRTLTAMEFLASRMGMDSIRDDHVQVIIHTLEHILHTRYFDFTERLREAGSKAEQLPPQQELLPELTGVISVCIGELCNKNKNYRESVRRYIAVLQATARALLPPAHAAWLSSEEAVSITKTYLKY